jgi:GNAT superfamily N-acetyltransferase
MEGLTTAPLTRQDSAAVAHVWRASELHDDGEAMFTEEDFVVACERPSMDLERHTIGVRDGDELVALAMLFGERSVFAHVHPSHRGRGIGAWLLRWTEDAARAVGHDRVSQTVSENEHAARALLEAAGYEPSWEDWLFRIELDREPDPPRLPAGYALREFVRGRDDRAVYEVVDKAFAEWPDHEPETFEDWAAGTFLREGFVPELIATVVQGEAIVGAAVMLREADDLFVAQLAVARPHRGRGLARALLVQSFATAWRAGLRGVELGTDSRTGARGLYEHVGMRVKRTFREYQKAL